MLTAIGDAFEELIGWIGAVISAIFGTATSGSSAGSWSLILPLIAIGLAISIVLVAVKVVRKLAWGM